MTLALYYAPGACSLAAHIALEEAGADFDARRVDIAGGGTRTPEYLAMNQHGSVPVLLRDDQPLTEGPAILGYVARAFPDPALLPADEFAAAQAMSFVAWCSSTVHVAFARIFRPERIAGPEHAEAVKGTAREALPAHFAELEARFAANEWAAGGQFTVADGYPFVFLRWARRVELDLAPYPAWQRHAWRMLDRAAVHRAVTREGLAPTDWIEAR